MRAQMASAKAHTRSPGFGCASGMMMSLMARARARAAERRGVSGVRAIVLRAAMPSASHARGSAAASPSAARSAGERPAAGRLDAAASVAVPRAPWLRRVVVSRAASAVVMRTGSPTPAKTRCNACSSGMPVSVSVGSASQSSAGPARSRPEMTMRASPWPSAPVSIFSMRPLSCAAPSMPTTTESSALTPRRSAAQVVPFVSDDHSPKVNALPAWSMSIVIAYSSHTSGARPEAASTRSTVCSRGSFATVTGAPRRRSRRAPRAGR